MHTKTRVKSQRKAKSKLVFTRVIAIEKKPNRTTKTEKKNKELVKKACQIKARKTHSPNVPFGDIGFGSRFIRIRIYRKGKKSRLSICRLQI